ncbi:hypothetical protein AB0F30_19825 [Streptomyces sp. NPDC029006]|uniref:hypothetical protein n=1 Tax=Streptomyces sp. NPDC029006 TaxID=3155467 RepID=UPI0033D0CA3B
MTTTIITRPQPSRTAPEYFCEACQNWHVGGCPAARTHTGHDSFAQALAAINSHRARPVRRTRSAEPGTALGTHLLAVVRAQDAASPAGRRAPRTVAEMRARLAALTEDESDACGVCGYWQCRCGQGRAQTAGTAVA